MRITGSFTIGSFLLGGYVVVWVLFVVSVRRIGEIQPDEGKILGIFRCSQNSTKLRRNEKQPVGCFPQYGTVEHTQMCGWSYAPEAIDERNCTLLVRPKARETQGVSQWTTDMVTFHFYALQAHCRLLFDYGVGIKIEEILSPNRHSWNWSVPPGFECKTPDCFLLQSRESLEQALNKTLAPIPLYRYAYSSDKYGGTKIYENDFRELHRVLPPGFNMSTGVACSLSTLFSLNTQGATAFVPNLNTEILPKLRQPDSFVMALYIRTHHADKMSHQKKGEHLEEPSYQERATDIINCALQLEKHHQQQTSRFVWMVVTDSPKLKQWISEAYASQTRHVVTTPSRGVHSRPSQTPSLSDIAEALIDWYLIGESNVAISDKESPTFGATAALRTARPLYDAETCQVLPLVHNEANRANDAATMRKHPPRQY